MSNPSKTHVKEFLNHNEENLPRDIRGDILMARLLGQHSKEDHSAEMKEQADKKRSSKEFPTMNFDSETKLDFNMWHSVGPIESQKYQISSQDDDEVVHRTHSEEFLNERSEMVYELLSQFKTDNKEIISKKFLAMSGSPDNCAVLRQSGCLPLLIQLIHGPGSNEIVREHASQALHSIVRHNTDEKQGRREARILALIEQLLEYCENEDHSPNPTVALSTLMKLSFDIEQRLTMCQFGGLHALAKTIEVEHARKNDDVLNLTPDDVNVRRYAAMSLTNLTCGDSTNKALLCSMKPFMLALVAQLDSPIEDLCQVTAGVIRNLSWRADTHTKDTLREVGATKMLMRTVLRVKKESTLKAILAALWNLSAHSDLNKVDICNVEYAIEFLVRMLTYQAPSGSPIIIENVGGILRNISKIIAIRDDYRAILREHNCLQILLQQLKSSSLAVVSNACGTLWNLTARSTEDQCTLIQLGAIDMLRSLTHSKHKMISIASSAALKNLMSCCSSPSVIEATKKRALTPHKPRSLERETGITSSYTYLTPTDSVINEKKGKESDGNTNGDLDVLPRTYSEEEEENVKSNSFRKVEEPYNVDDEYAETDVDQPTNYSLKFSEHPNDSHPATDLEIRENKTSVPDSKLPSSPLNESLPTHTPLMFSRRSSMDSVSSCGGPMDDQASVVSEYSRAVSGIVSPSDLPDSPTQTVPPTPRPQTQQFRGPLTKNVFDDEVTVFKDESTPIQFSVATSLSSLTFEDDTYVVDGLAPVVEKPETSSSGNTTSNSQTVVAIEDEKDDSLEVDLSLEEQQALAEAAVVNKKPSATQRTVLKSVSSENVTIPKPKVVQDSMSRSMFQSATLTDSTINYCTEDTPISISHAASNSDLSLLCPSEDSFLQNSILPLSSCLDSEQENLLNMCIAKGKQSLSLSNPNSLDDNQSSQSSTLSEITEDLPIEDRTLIKDIMPNVNLISSMTTTSSITDNDFMLDEVDSKDLSEEDEEDLLNQCIALGMRSVKETSDLENIGPPSFLAEANLDSSLTNVEEITDYPPSPAKTTPKQKRRQIKERYNTYTLKQISPTKTTAIVSPTKREDTDVVVLKKPSATPEDRRSSEKDRFKTRTLTKTDFEELVRCQNKEKSLEPETAEPVIPQTPASSQCTLHKSDESSTTSDNDESYHEVVGARIVKPVTPKMARSGIPVVSSKLPKTKNPTVVKKLPPSELPVSLQRQNTFTKEETSSIPVLKESIRPAGSNSSSKTTTPTTEISASGVLTSPPFRSGIPSRIKETATPKSAGNRLNDKKSPDIVKNYRWSMSENNLNATSTFKTTGSTTSLNTSGSSPFNTPSPLKGNPSASQSALPVRKESAVRTTAFYAYNK